jgi:electron transport complex protein RnfE
MGIAATAVLLGSNVVISMLRKIVPDKVRIPCYIVVIAGFVTIVQMLVKAYAPALDKSLGIFLPLIVVNCIILGRAEMFAAKNGVFDSVLDAIGMGLGFTLALFLMASIREAFGAGTWLGMSIPVLSQNNISIMTMAPGGFFVFGVLIALVNKISDGRAIKRKEIGCAGCPNAVACTMQSQEDNKE